MVSVLLCTVMWPMFSHVLIYLMRYKIIFGFSCFDMMS